MATWKGLEPSTSGVTGQRSNQLSYQAIYFLATSDTIPQFLHLVNTFFKFFYKNIFIQKQNSSVTPLFTVFFKNNIFCFYPKYLNVFLQNQKTATRKLPFFGCPQKNFRRYDCGQMIFNNKNQNIVNRTVLGDSVRELHTKTMCFLLQPLPHSPTKRLFGVLRKVRKRIGSAVHPLPV